MARAAAAHGLPLPFHGRPPPLPLPLRRPRHLRADLSRCLRATGPARVSTASVDRAPSHPEFDFCGEIARLMALRSRLASAQTHRDKLRVLRSEPRVVRFFTQKLGKALSSLGLHPSEMWLLECLVAAGQEHVLLLEAGGEQGRRSGLKSAMSVLLDFVEKLEGWGGRGVQGQVDASVKELVRVLGEIDKFYDCIGGIIGYQIKVLELLSPLPSGMESMNWTDFIDDSRNYVLREFHVPVGCDLSKDTEYASQAALWGIEGMQQLGEIYPMGGCGDRLGLVDSITGECLPAAMLPYCGQTLLEGLIRDLQAREFLHYKLYGKQCVTPVAIMTSSAKNNHERITALCESLSWFGRGKSNFKLFEQPLVPCIDAGDGQWLITEPFSLVSKPGGHGALWKLAYDKGIFQWFFNHGRKGATIRQVSNVVAGTDTTMLALAGIGLRKNKKLGFASCRKEVGATEGINVLVEERKSGGQWAYGITCIEYTEFEKLGISDTRLHAESLQLELPANTNILYVDLMCAERVGSSRKQSCLPGMLLNLKKPVVFKDGSGISHSVSGGRLECTMQKIADQFVNVYTSRRFGDVEDALDTFIVYNDRRKVTSSAKRKRCEAKSLHQTPEGSLLDIIRNASELLSHCDIKLPFMEENSNSLHYDPPFLIFLNPALGPLWHITRQKFCGGSISRGSEVQIEVAEFLWRDVEVDGSILIVAENIVGSRAHEQEPLIQYGHRCGRCKLQNVKVFNKGIDWNCCDNVYWKHEVKRLETLKIILHGNAEFEAVNVVLHGSYIFEVPDGHKLCVTMGMSGVSCELHRLRDKWMERGSWFWNYKINNNNQIQLKLVEL